MAEFKEIGNGAVPLKKKFSKDVKVEKAEGSKKKRKNVVISLNEQEQELLERKRFKLCEIVKMILKAKRMMIEVRLE